MNWSALRYFIAVSETGSFTRAADRLRVSQPSLSISLRRLEEELGQPLLERGGKRAELTPFGHRFLLRAQTILSEYEAARGEARATTANPERLRLGILTTLPSHPIIKWVERFRAAHPYIELDIAEASLTVLERRISQSRLDAMLSIIPENSGRETSQIFFQERYSLALMASHRLATRPRLKLSDLKGLPFVVRPDCEVLSQAERAFAKVGLKPTVIARTNHEARLLEYVRIGLGAAFVPESLAQHPGISLIEIAELRLARRIGLTWRPSIQKLAEPLAQLGLHHDWGTEALSENTLAH